MDNLVLFLVVLVLAFVGLLVFAENNSKSSTSRRTTNMVFVRPEYRRRLIGGDPSTWGPPILPPAPPRPHPNPRNIGGDPSTWGPPLNPPSPTPNPNNIGGNPSTWGPPLQPKNIGGNPSTWGPPLSEKFNSGGCASGMCGL